ncbi:MAG TPA: thioredoxin domain-containing protein [Allosphingosinicella sp.]|jgi:protein-disulfide isomerase
MIRRLALGLAAAALAGAAASLPAAPAKQAAARDWTKAVAVTPEGGYRIGNPAAPVKLVEYGSFTCNHCARFAEQGVPVLLDKYVKSGRVSFEFRNFVRDPADMAAALLSRCAATGDYFSLADRYFRTQPQWMARIQSTAQAQQAELAAMSPRQQVSRFAALGGLDALAVQGGIPAAKAQACLGDAAAVAKLVEMRKVAVEQHKLEGTPMFLLNGKKAEHVHDWSSLEPLLGSPGG